MPTQNHVGRIPYPESPILTAHTANCIADLVVDIALANNHRWELCAAITSGAQEIIGAGSGSTGNDTVSEDAISGQGADGKHHSQVTHSLGATVLAFYGGK